MGCAEVAGDLGLVPALIAQADCHAEALASGGYGALTANGGLVPVLATAALTLYVAFLGWRLLLGHPLHIGDWSMALLKVGFVLALTSQWPVYQKLLYETATHGPNEVAEAVLEGYRGRSGAPPVGLAALQRGYSALAAAAAAAQPQAQGATSVNPSSIDRQPAPPAPAAPSRPPQATDFALAALLLLVSTAGVMVAAKLLTALVLAVGPLVLLLVLFEQTRGLTIGWARALIGLALTLLVGEVLATIEVSLLQPVLRALDPMNVVAPAAPAQGGAALAVTSVCALAVLLGVTAAWVVALGFRPRPRRRTASEFPQAAAPAIMVSGAERPAELASRAGGFAVTNAAAVRRDARVVVVGGGRPLRSLAPSSSEFVGGHPPAGQGGSTLQRRSPKPKLSAAAERRDR